MFFSDVFILHLLTLPAINRLEVFLLHHQLVLFCESLLRHFSFAFGFVSGEVRKNRGNIMQAFINIASRRKLIV